MTLSIGQAWDEAKAVFRADGRPILAIALALTVLPGTILETVAPSSTRTTETHWSIATLGLLAALLSLTGQVAISRIALGHQATVGEALALAFRRMPVLFAALILAIVPFALVLTMVSVSFGVNLNPATVPAGVTLAAAAITLLGLFVLVRLIFLTPLAADRAGGPIALLKEAWRLSKGRFLKLVGLLLILMLVGLLLLGALGGALSAAVILLLGKITAGSVSALLVALIQQCLAALVSVLFVVVVCRLYVQATGGTNVSVPHAGHGEG